MPRLAVLITDRPAADANAQVSAMIAAMMPEPFYTSGLCSAPELGCYAGWVDQRGRDAATHVQRLGSTILVFAGEDFGAAHNHRPEMAALLSAYERDGARCLRLLNGWFAGVLIDLRKQQALVFNDRFGFHRLHYTRTGETHAFASEAKALLAIRPESRSIDPEGLGEFFALGCQIGERTFFRDVSRLPGGSVWTVRRDRQVLRDRYFTPAEYEQRPLLDEREYYDRLKQVLSDSIPRYMTDADPVAVSLTGGFDTRAIMAFDDQTADRRLSYTYGGMYRDCLDVTVARQVARACGYEHHVLPIDAAFMAQYPACAEKTVWVTDGTLDVSVAHEVYLSGLARSIAPIRMTGNYGSEVLRGTSTFRPIGLSRQMFTPDFVPYIEAGEASWAAARKTHPVSFAIFHEIPSNLYGRFAAAESQLTLRSPFLDNALVDLAFQAPPGRSSVTECWTRLITERNPALAAIPTDRGQLGTASAIASLPGRLYNHLLFKAEWYYEGGMPDWLSPIDARLTRHRRPPFFAGTHKMQHYRVWFRDHLADWVDSMLSDTTSSARPYLNRRYAGDIAAAHRDGRRNYVPEISALATVELIHRLFIDASSAARFRVPDVRELQSHLH